MIGRVQFHFSLEVSCNINLYKSCEFTVDGSSAAQDESSSADLTYEDNLCEENVESDRGATAKLSSQIGKY